LAEDILNLSLIISPKIGGIVKAEAMATISLIKRSPRDGIGKGLTFTLPKNCANFLSLIKLQVVLTPKTTSSF